LEYSASQNAKPLIYPVRWPVFAEFPRFDPGFAFLFAYEVQHEWNQLQEMG
jgi:hypothetical protein